MAAKAPVLALFHLLSLQEFTGTLNPEPESLSSFKVAWERTQEMQQIFLALLQAAATSEKDDDA